MHHNEPPVQGSKVSDVEVHANIVEEHGKQDPSGHPLDQFLKCMANVVIIRQENTSKISTEDRCVAKTFGNASATKAVTNDQDALIRRSSSIPVLVILYFLGGLKCQTSIPEPLNGGLDRDQKKKHSNSERNEPISKYGVEANHAFTNGH